MSFKADSNPARMVPSVDAESSHPDRRSKSSTLVTTKIIIPPLRKKMVKRGRLLDRLSAGKDRKLIVITGAAGAGKTSLTCQWIAREKPTVAWFSADSMDNDTDLFFRYFLLALGSVSQRLLSILNPIIQDQRKLVSGEIITSVIEALIDEPENVYLVIDDYHLITSREIHDALFYFLSYMPVQMHIIIISRQRMPFSTSHFKVRNQVLEISAWDMKFTEKETEAFFTDVMPINLSPNQMQELGRHTEGWVGGLQLLGLSLHGESDIPDFQILMKKTCYEATNYLISEVVNIQREEVKSFIYATALLDRFNIQVCQEVTGLEEVSPILDHLYRNNLFLIPLDAERGWYRYNHLFSDVIRTQIALGSANLFLTVNKRAAMWFAENGYLEDAFRHAFASNDFDFAADLMENYVHILCERYDNLFCLRWFERLPHNIFMQRPMLKLYECILKIESYELIDIQTFLQDIKGGHPSHLFDRYGKFKKKCCEDILVYLKHVYPHCCDPEVGGIQQLNKALKKISPKNRFIICLIKDVIAVHHLVQGNPVSAKKVLEETMPVVFSSESLWNKIDWFKTMAFAERWQGHLLQSDIVVQKAFQFLERKGLSDSPMKAILYLPMAWIYYFRNDLTKALKYVITAIQYIEPSGYIKDFIEASLAASFIHLACGKMDDAEEYMQKMSWTVKLTGNLNLIALSDAAIARLSMAQGDIKRAEEWSEKRKMVMTQAFSHRFIWESLAQGELFYLKGMYKEASNLLEILRNRCAKRNMLEAVLRIDILQSANFFNLHDYEQAENTLERALSFSEAEGYIRPFSSYRSMITPILSKLMSTMCNAKISSHILSIMQACGINTKGVMVPDGSEKLTPREMEMLMFLAAGLKYKEIADKAFVSLETVKTHIKNVYEKLNVNTRPQAIKRAQEWKIIHKSN